jgi:hypothetical protein
MRRSHCAAEEKKCTSSLLNDTGIAYPRRGWKGGTRTICPRRMNTRTLYPSRFQKDSMTNYPGRSLKETRITYPRRFIKDTRINDPGPGACQLPATVHLLASENQLVTALCDTGVPRTDQESPG